MPTPLKISGTVASPGYAAGPVFRLERQATAYAPSGSSETEAARLGSAIMAARDQVVAADQCGGSGELPRFSSSRSRCSRTRASREPALAAIADGTDAASAWTSALDGQVAEYAGAEDAYFSARSADIADIRDRVLDALGGASAGEVPPGSVLVGRRYLADGLPQRRLDKGRRHRPRGGQRPRACRDAGARPRVCRCWSAQVRWQSPRASVCCSMPSTAASWRNPRCPTSRRSAPRATRGRAASPAQPMAVPPGGYARRHGDLDAGEHRRGR